MTSPDEGRLDVLAAEALDDVDVRTLADLARMYAVLDPVPVGLVDRIRFGITLDALHAEIAELERFDDLAGARAESATGANTVTFTSANLTIMITISAQSADRVRIDGWAAPGGGVRIDLRSVDGVRTEIADADGRFVFEDVPRGLAQLVARPPDGHPAAPVITPSIEL